MNINLVSHPIYHRPLTWRIIAHIIVIGLLVASGVKQDWFGMGVLIAIWCGYIWYIRQDQESLLATIYEDKLEIADKSFSWQDIQHISIEIDESQPAYLALYIQPKDKRRNIVYGFALGQDNKDIAIWLQEIEKYILINGEITLDSFHRVRRWLRI